MDDVKASFDNCRIDAGSYVVVALGGPRRDAPNPNAVDPVVYQAPPCSIRRQDGHLDALRGKPFTDLVDVAFDAPDVWDESR
jgi:hypothetical protein